MERLSSADLVVPRNSKTPGDRLPKTALERTLVMTVRWQDYIEERKDVMLGKPDFKGTRLTVEHILRELGTGMSLDELFDNYPNLKPEHLQAANQYAADVMAMDQVLFQ
jgi:uncharacterized protein (DUF433 family)